MKIKTLLLTGLLLAVFCFAVLLFSAGSCKVEFPNIAQDGSLADYTVKADPDESVFRIEDVQLENGILSVTIRGVSRGKAYLEVTGPEGHQYYEVIYVHAFRLITVNGFFGKAQGSWIIPIAALLYLLLILHRAICLYRKGMKETLYQYKNIRSLGWVLMLSLMVIGQLPRLLSRASLIDTLEMMLGSAASVSLLVFPIAFVTSILVAISNLQLMRKEGRNWRNMLGLLLGLLLLVGTVFPHVFSAILQRSTAVNVHDEQGWALYAEMIAYNAILLCVSYLECILLATILLGFKAARRIPAFDKDYILILGCQIRKDGSLTPLLKGRVDRALEFARLQKEATGKDILFVPSGGQGSDEVISEAEAMRRYLLESGIPKERILPEDQSLNTLENLRNSARLIRENGGEEAKIAFSTTNYHVFRSGILAEQEGVHAEGIGSRTRSYFWINAFIREFIATVYSERRHHLRIIAMLLLVMLLFVCVVYLSNIL